MFCVILKSETVYCVSVILYLYLPWRRDVNEYDVNDIERNFERMKKKPEIKKGKYQIKENNGNKRLRVKERERKEGKRKEGNTKRRQDKKRK